MNDLSFDLETLGIDPNALILSIGAVRFDRKTGEMGEEFYRLIDLSDYLGSQGTVNVSTVVWWMQQNDQARADVFGKDLQRVPMEQALSDFWAFCHGAETFWQRGDMDAQWLGNAYKRGDFPGLPWKFWQLRDQRTLPVELGHLIERAERGTVHNALADAKAQAVEMIAIYQVLQGLGAIW